MSYCYYYKCFFLLHPSSCYDRITITFLLWLVHMEKNALSEITTKMLPIKMCVWVYLPHLLATDCSMLQSAHRSSIWQPTKNTVICMRAAC